MLTAPLVCQGQLSPGCWPVPAVPPHPWRTSLLTSLLSLFLSLSLLVQAIHDDDQKASALLLQEELLSDRGHRGGPPLRHPHRHGYQPCVCLPRMLLLHVPQGRIRRNIQVPT